MVARACANMSSRSLLFIVKIPPPSDVLAYISVGLLLKGYISKMVNSRNRINEKIIFLHVNNTEEICDLMHSFFD